MSQAKAVLPRMPPRQVEHLLKSKPKVKSTIQTQPETYQAGIMGLMGLSAKTIVAHTGLRPHQVTYRLHRTGVKISDYRSGKGPVAEFVMQKVAAFAREEFIERMREKLNLSAPA
jgi:hypothetical protein